MRVWQPSTQKKSDSGESGNSIVVSGETGSVLQLNRFTRGFAASAHRRSVPKGNAPRFEMKHTWTRRELLIQSSKIAGASLLGGALAIPGCGGGARTSPAPPPGGDGYAGTDDQLLEEIEKTGFLFFWEQADPKTGQVKDRALAAGNDTRTISSIAATGFGLTALCIADQRGYQPHPAIVSSVQATLNFLAN